MNGARRSWTTIPSASSTRSGPPRRWDPEVSGVASGREIGGSSGTVSGVVAAGRTPGPGAAVDEAGVRAPEDGEISLAGVVLSAAGVQAAAAIIKPATTTTAAAPKVRGNVQDPSIVQPR